MVPADDHPSESRPPTVEDLVGLCRRLNEMGARYLVIGGFAVIHHGFTRTTEDIDLLIESSLANQALVKQALEYLPDQAVKELGNDDLRDWVVVRVVDEITVDLMMAACGIGFDEAFTEIQTVEIRGVSIPFASPRLLQRMKQTYREKDAMDRRFLTELIRKQEPP